MGETESLSYNIYLSVAAGHRPVDLLVKVSRFENGSIHAFVVDLFFQVESYQCLKNKLPSQAPVVIGSALVLVGPVSDRTFDLQLSSQCGSAYTCLSRTVPEIH